MIWWEKFQPLLIFVSVAVGLSLARITSLNDIWAFAVAPLLAAMLYVTFLPIPLREFRQTQENLKVTVISLAINFLWTPVFAWGLGALFLNHTPDLWVGLIMLMVTPCTDWYLVFTGVAGGDVGLATTLLPINLLLQIILLPLYLLLFTGTIIELDSQVLFTSFWWVVVIPLLMAIATRKLAIYGKGNGWWSRFMPKIILFQILFLNLAIVAIFASEGNLVWQKLDLFFTLLMPLVLFFMTNFLLGQFIGRYLKLSYEKQVCLNYTTLARNSPLSLAIAASVFPHHPLISVTLIIAPLIELPILGIISQFLLFLRLR